MFPQIIMAKANASDIFSYSPVANGRKYRKDGQSFVHSQGKAMEVSKKWETIVIYITPYVSTTVGLDSRGFSC